MNLQAWAFAENLQADKQNHQRPTSSGNYVVCVFETIIHTSVLSMKIKLCLGMHDEIFHFEIFKNFVEFRGNFEIFQDPFFEIFHEIFNFHCKVT